MRTLLVFLLLLLPIQSSFAASQWRKGGLIGAAAGMGAGLVGMASYCGTRSQFETCFGFGTPPAMLGGALVGFGIGSLIGSQQKAEEGTGKKEGSYAFRGMLIGAGIGLAAGIGTAVAINNISCHGDECIGKGLALISVPAAPLVLGGLVGAIIGASMHRQQDVVLFPTFSNRFGTTAMGLGMGLDF